MRPRGRHDPPPISVNPPSTISRHRRAAVAMAHRATITADRRDRAGNDLTRRRCSSHQARQDDAQRAIKAGRLSAGRKEDGGYEIDPSELARVYRVYLPGEATDETVAATDPMVHHATVDAEVAVLRATAALLREQLGDRDRAIEDLRRERDEWRDQAKRLVLPAPQPPAEAVEQPSRLRRGWRWMRANP